MNYYNINSPWFSKIDQFGDILRCINDVTNFSSNFFLSSDEISSNEE